MRRVTLHGLIFCAAFAILCLRLPAQVSTEGAITVVVQDSQGAVVVGAKLSLRDLGTNSVRSGKSTKAGTYTFVGLPPATYALTITHPGFQAMRFPQVVVQSGQYTDLRATLQIGAINSTVTVKGSSVPLLQTTSDAISSNIDIKQLNDLPLAGRDVSQLASLVPGANGTWNGLPTTAQGDDINGVTSSTSRMKFAGNAFPLVEARLEDMQEMTVATDQLGLARGYGQSDMEVSFTMKRGTNQFHGQAYEDFQNSGLNSNSWFNNAAGIKRPELIHNDFGFTFGGPIFHNKMFIFGSYAETKQPGSSFVSDTVMASAVQSGNLTYRDNNGLTHTVNVLTQIAQPNNLPFTVNPKVASDMQAINGGLNQGAVTKTGDPNINQISWLNSSPLTVYYPAFRLDYNASDNLRLDLSFLDQKTDQPNISAPPFPGTGFANRVASNNSNNFTTGLGITWTISPTLVNQFRGGYLYNVSRYAYDAQPLWYTQPQINWAGSFQSGQWFNLPVTTYYPVVSGSDTLSWIHGAHNWNFGFSYFREQDHYWNPPAGFPIVQLGLDGQDPANSAFSQWASQNNVSPQGEAEAKALYATLVGRIDNVTGSYALNPKTGQYLTGPGAYNLDELQHSFGLYAEDSWHIRPDLTLNYGLRWDFTGDDHDLTGAYHSANTPADIWGPTPPGDIFQPGNLGGNMNPVYVASSHQYKPWHISPQPALGLAWNPNIRHGVLGALFGGHKTVVRIGYSLRRYTEPYQYFWNAASNMGFAFYQNFSLYPANGGGVGTFTPGSLALGDSLPPYYVTPQSYQKVITEASQTFFGYWSGVNGMNPEIKQPYTQSWNFGIQRELGRNNVLELRYIGNRSLHQWITVNPNEVNVFSNGFLSEFKQAQQYLQQNGGNSFAPPNGQSLPIFQAADPSGGIYTDGTLINALQTGQAGLAAGYMSGNPNYLCNMVGNANFSPCDGFASGAGAYPINFFQANPFNAGKMTGYLDSVGYSNYNALQVELRQKPWRGMEFDVNYTWSHTLGVEPGNSWTGSFNLFTMRNLQLSYGPTLFDFRHVVHAYGTYELPIGRGKAFLNQGGIVNKVLGDWTVGSVITLQTGAPFRLTGGNLTFNDFADGGLNLKGVSISQLQSAVGVYPVPSSPFADGINPKYLASATGGGASSSYITPNTAPGTLASNFWLHGPGEFFQDLSLTKNVGLTERVHMELQGEFLNVWNHPVWGSPDGGVQDYGFGLTGVMNSPRSVQLRANFTF